MHRLKHFKQLELKPALLDALHNMNFHEMTEVQELAIPLLLERKDLVVRSKTGSGKTGAYLVPIFEKLEHKGHPQSIIILPTRELATQVSNVAERLARATGMRVALVYGGVSINVQIRNIANGADLVIGTPGRILDLMERGALRLDRIKLLVLDEADLMLDMGFIEDVEQIVSSSPKDRQTILLSATMPREILGIARKYMKEDAAKLTVGEEEDITVSTITHYYFVASGRLKFSALLAYIDKFKPEKCIIFTATQREAEFVHRFLRNNDFDAIVMHGGLTQAKREYSLRSFKQHARFLISTNLASRGLDIPDVSDIINFDAPDEPKIYVHRVGRSARMGKYGRAFTIYGMAQRGLMQDTMRLANVKMTQVELDTNKFRDIELPIVQRQERRYGFRPGHGRPQGGEQQGRYRHSQSRSYSNERRPYQGQGNRSGGFSRRPEQRRRGYSSNRD